MQPFSLRIFVADGDPDDLRIVERSNWVGRALVSPREDGEGDPIKPRLASHHSGTAAQNLAA